MLLYAAELKFLNSNNCEHLTFIDKRQQNLSPLALVSSELTVLNFEMELWVCKFCLNFCGKLLLILNYVPNAHQSEVRERQEGRVRLPCLRVPLLSRCPAKASPLSHFHFPL